MSVCADDAGHLIQSPAAQGMARSLSEIVQQLFTNDQLSKDCARALSLQLGSFDATDMQQIQGVSLHALLRGASACSSSWCHTSADCKTLHCT